MRRFANLNFGGDQAKALKYLNKKTKGESMNIEQIKSILDLLDDAKIPTSLNTDLNSECVDEWVIVRSHSSGVHFGKLHARSGDEVILKESRRMWRWWAIDENSLSGVARHGINRDKSKICGTLNKIILPEVCEVIPVSEICRVSIFECPVYNEQN